MALHYPFTTFIHSAGNIDSGNTADYVNHKGFNTMSVGNHEFDDGLKGLLPFVKKAEFPIVSTNLNFKKEKEFESKINI